MVEGARDLNFDFRMQKCSHGGPGQGWYARYDWAAVLVELGPDLNFDSRMQTCSHGGLGQGWYAMYDWAAVLVESDLDLNFDPRMQKCSHGGPGHGWYARYDWAAVLVELDPEPRGAWWVEHRESPGGEAVRNQHGECPRENPTWSWTGEAALYSEGPEEWFDAAAVPGQPRS